jgi:ribosome-associated protein
MTPGRARPAGRGLDVPASAEWVSRLAGRDATDVDSQPRDLAIAAARAADDKLGRETVILEVGDVLAITDYFVITAGNNDRQVKAILDEVEAQLTASHGLKPLRVEGLDNLTWVLMDYGAFVVHIFAEETRSYYELERLWKDVPRVAWQEPR